MPKFAANLTLMYNEHAFPDRFATVSKDGFTGVEFLFSYSFVIGEIQAWLQDNGLIQAVFNCPPSDWVAEEHGIASLPGRERG